MMPSRPDHGVAQRAFLARKLHSLLGVVPLGAFVFAHLWTNAAVLAGPRAFDRAVARIQHTPGLLAFEILLIGLPIVAHAVYGSYLAVVGVCDRPRYRRGGVWLPRVHRATGLFIVAFLALHLWDVRLQKAFFGLSYHAFYGRLVEVLGERALSIPWRAFVYVAGVVATTFHLGYGAWRFAQAWNLVRSREARRRLAWGLGVVCGVFALLGILTVAQLTTGALLPTSLDADGPSPEDCRPTRETAEEPPPMGSAPAAP